MNAFASLSELIFSFMMNTRAADYEHFQNGPAYGGGMEYLFIVLLLVPLAFAATYYFGVAQKLANGTKKNYLVVFLIGFLTLWMLNFVVMATAADLRNPFSSGNMWKINLIEIIYYPIVYQLYSWFMKSASKVKNIDLISCLSNK